MNWRLLALTILVSTVPQAVAQNDVAQIQSAAMQQATLDTPIAPPIKPPNSDTTQPKASYAFQPNVQQNADSRGSIRIEHKRHGIKTAFWKLKYYFVAQNVNNCDLFYGLIQHNPFLGGAVIDFAFPSGCICHGTANITYVPPLAALGLTCAGEQGDVTGTCSDGRTIRGNFIMASFTTGNGSGSDSLGNQYQFTFGHTADQAVQKVNELRRTLHCPECTGQDIELKVQAQILQAH